MPCPFGSVTDRSDETAITRATDLVKFGPQHDRFNEAALHQRRLRNLHRQVIASLFIWAATFPLITIVVSAPDVVSF
jgi:hypothetical protein